MGGIGALLGFVVLVALLWSRISAERRQEEREDCSTTNQSLRQLPWRAPRAIDAAPAEGSGKQISHRR